MPKLTLKRLQLETKNVIFQILQYEVLIYLPPEQEIPLETPLLCYFLCWMIYFSREIVPTGYHYPKIWYKT